jgi:hypothetical protein
LCGAGALARVSLQQPLGMFGRKPSPFFGDADGNDFIFSLIDCVKDGRSRQQRDFVLAAASAKEDADADFFYCHANSSLALGGFSVNAGAGYGRTRSNHGGTEDALETQRNTWSNRLLRAFNP